MIMSKVKIYKGLAFIALLISLSTTAFADRSQSWDMTSVNCSLPDGTTHLLFLHDLMDEEFYSNIPNNIKVFNLWGDEAVAENVEYFEVRDRYRLPFIHVPFLQVGVRINPYCAVNFNINLNTKTFRKASWQMIIY